MATVMSGGDDWIGFPVNHLSTMQAGRPMLARQLIFIVFNSKENKRSCK